MFGDEEFKDLLHYFNRPWKGYRKVRKGVIKRLRHHMKELDCSSLTEYIKVIEQNEEEYLRCQECLRVTISRFFRDREVWYSLRDRLLPELLDEWPQGLNVWSGGCSCGEEPYSLAIIWSMLDNPAGIHILATDADSRCLARARQGIYPRSSLKELPVDAMKYYFHRIEGGSYKAKQFLQENIRWQRRDLLAPPPEGLFQIVFLRNNLLTYYNRPLVDQILESITAQLAPGGILIIGTHENLPELRTSFRQDRSRCIYRKI